MENNNNNNDKSTISADEFMAGAIDVNCSDLTEHIMPVFTPQIKKELNEKTEDNSNKLLIDTRHIERILGIKQNNKFNISKKNVTFETALFEEIKLLSKYEEVPANKLIITAVKQYVEDRRHILDKIEEIRNLHAIPLDQLLKDDKEEE